MSKSHFLICDEYINNNSYINLGYGNHIRILWSCSNAVKTHNVNIFHKILATGLSVAKFLIKFISNNLEDTMKKRKKKLILSLLNKKLILKMMKLILTLDDQMDKRKTGKILLWINSLRIIKASWWGKFIKK